MGSGGLGHGGPIEAPHETAVVAFQFQYVVWAVLVGALSAISLLFGSVVGVLGKQPKGVTAALAAFGAGALIAALAVELVAPTVNALHGGGGHGHGDPRAAFYALLVGSVIGGVLFVVLDQMVNRHGGFLRKTALTVAHMAEAKRRHAERILDALSGVEILREVPPDLVQDLVEVVFEVPFTAGDTLFEQGERGDRVFFLTHGSVELRSDGRAFKSVGPGTVLGEISLLTDAPRVATGVAETNGAALVLGGADFHRLREKSPELDAAVRAMASERIDELRVVRETRDAAARTWAEEAAEALRQGVSPPTAVELRKMSEEYHGAPLAIWLGILLDGIPESLVIGAGVLGLVAERSLAGVEITLLDVIPYTLVAGLFLSNFPEAMSSSVGMREQGKGSAKIIGMWSSLVVVTAVGAGLGFVLGETLPPTVVVGIEGVAAGAMLTMIASTMLPEAVHLGGPNVVGLSTLLGFLAAISFKLLE